MSDSLLKLRDNYYISTKLEKVENILKNTALLRLNYTADKNSSQLSREIIKKIKQKEKLLLSINIENKLLIGNAIKDIKKIKQLCKKNKVKFGIDIQDKKIVVANIEKYEENKEIYTNIIHTLNAIFYENIEEKYNYLYDAICDYLDNEFIKKNLCGFKNDKCKVKKESGIEMGCCYHCKNKYFGMLYTNKFNLCEYLKDKRCSAKCITCKLYTCSELQKQGIKYNTKNVLLIRYFFNPIQKFVIISSHFTPKQKIMKKILRYSFVK